LSIIPTKIHRDWYRWRITWARRAQRCRGRRGRFIAPWGGRAPFRRAVRHQHPDWTGTNRI